MPSSRKEQIELIEENQRLRAQVAQLEDKIDHLMEYGANTKVLQQSENVHREVMSSVGDVVMIADEAGRLSYISPNSQLVFGLASTDIFRQGRVNYVLPHELFDPVLLEQRGEISNIECQIRDSVGRARNLQVTVRRLKSLPGNIMYVCRDVTERLKVELNYDLLSLTLEKRIESETSELRESRDRYRRLVEGLRDDYMFFATDVDGIITYVSPSIHSILGYLPSDVIGQNWRDYVDKTDAGYQNLERLEVMRYAGLETPLYCAAVPHANGEIRILEFRDVPLRDRNGKVIANEGIGKDVTEQNAAEVELRKAHEELEQRVAERTAELVAKNEQLRQSQERYFSVIKDHLEFIVRWSDDGVRTYVNDSYCSHLGMAAGELVGASFISTILEEDRQILLQKLAAVYETNPVVEFEHRTITPDGRTVWEHWTHRALFNNEGELVEYQSVGCDVTERRKREENAQDRAEAAERLRTLTDRERAVLRLVVAGDANKVVARKLGLSIKTIEKHRSSLMKKLHVRSVPELVRLALLADTGGRAYFAESI